MKPDRSPFILAVLLLLWGTHADSALGVEISFEEPFADRDPIDAAVAALSPSAPADTIAARLLSALLALGHGEAEVAVARDDSFQRARLRPGPIWRLGEIRFVGSRLFEESELVGRLDLRPGRPFETGAVARDLSRLLESWGRRGHIFARFKLRPRRVADGRVDLTVVVDDGPLVHLGELRARGNETTGIRTLERASGLRPGRVLDRRVFDRSAERLRRLGYFSEVRGPVLTRGAAADLVDAELALVEAPTHSAEGVLGYAPAEEGGEDQLTGYLELSLHNLFGTGRELDLSWERVRAEELTLQVQWRERWVFGSDASLLASFAQVVQDSTFLEDMVGVEIAYPIGWGFDGSLRFRRERVVPGRRRDRLAPARSSTSSAGIGLTRDGRDAPWNPRRGVLLVSALDLGRRGSEAMIRGRGLVELSLPLASRQSWFAGLDLMALEPPPGPVQLPDLFRVGGSGSLRGQREDELRVLRGGIATGELRFHTGGMSRVALFVDAAYLRRAEAAAQGARLVWRSHVGYGLGLRIGSRAGLLGIDYGVGAGDSPMNGKIHLSIQNLF
ncbi:MAG: hypothetical protein CME06_13290 [Gemmatimonadetes bacterium]|nr:hypothetical protein [Gemmatimonadota bacterium]